MRASAKEYLSNWYTTWQQELADNLAQQATLQEDAAALNNLLATCEQAFAMLFPAPPPAPVPTEATPTEAPAPTEPPAPIEPPAPEVPVEPPIEVIPDEPT